MKIRLAKKEDLLEMSKIVEKNYDIESSKEAYKEFQMMFKNNPIKPTFYVAIIDDKIVGIGGFSQSFINYYVYEILWINVLDNFRGKGIGYAIVSKIIEKIKSFKGENKAKFIILTSRKKKLYEKLGFRVLLNYENFEKKDDNLMILDL